MLDITYKELYPDLKKYLIRNFKQFNIQDIEDIINTSFLSLWKSYASLKDKSKIKSWVYTSVINSARSYHKSKKNFKILDKQFDIISTVTPETVFQRKQQDNIIKTILATGPTKRQQQALTLRFYEDMSSVDMGKIMKCSDITARKTFRQAFNHFKERDRFELVDESNDIRFLMEEE